MKIGCDRMAIRPLFEGWARPEGWRDSHSCSVSMSGVALWLKRSDFTTGMEFFRDRELFDDGPNVSLEIKIRG